MGKGKDGALPSARATHEPSPTVSAVPALVPNAFELMQQFYLSRYYEPKPDRPADNIQAAIEFAIERAEAAVVVWLRSQKGHPQAVEPAREATRFYASIFADRIERGAHRSGEEF